MWPWVKGAILTVLFVLIAIGNAQWFWQGVVRKEKTGSSVPLAGGLLGWLGLMQFPVPLIQEWAWLAFMLDAGCLLYALLLVKLLFNKLTGNAAN